MKNLRLWVFRVLVVLAAILMVYTWVSDWWVADVVELSARGVVIHPWGLTMDLSFAQQLVTDVDMPVWFAPMMWAYLVVCLALLAFSLFSWGRTITLARFKFPLPQFLIGLVGLSYIVCALVAVLYASYRMSNMGAPIFAVPLQGITHMQMGEGIGTDVYTSLKTAYYLTYVAGAALLVLAVFRDRIVGSRPA